MKCQEKHTIIPYVYQYNPRVKTSPVQVGATLVEAANFEVPGFATGCYMAAACGGRVLWEEAAPDS